MLKNIFMVFLSLCLFTSLSGNSFLAFANDKRDVPINTSSDEPKETTQKLVPFKVAWPNIWSETKSFDFGNVDIGSTSQSKNLFLINTGYADLIITEVYLIGPDADMFDAVAGGGISCPRPPITLYANVSCSIVVTFTPTSVGTKNVELRVISNDPDTPEFNISFNGLGVETKTN